MKKNLNLAAALHISQKIPESPKQWVLKTFPGPGYLRSEDGVAWLWHLLVNLCIYIYISADQVWWFDDSMSCDLKDVFKYAPCPMY